MKNIQDIIIGNREFRVEVVSSRTDLERGLGNRRTMPTGQGMMFLYNRPWYYTFWMKDMRFAIDVIGIDKDGKVVEIMKGLRPELNVPYYLMKRYTFRTPILAALEVNERDSYGINRGDYIEIIGEDNDGFDETNYE